MCKLHYFVQSMSSTASISILTVISLERYVAIIYPMRSKQLQTIGLLRAAVVGIWTISASSGLPFLIIYKTISMTNAGNETIAFCVPSNEYEYNARAHATFCFLLWYVLPLTMMTFVYTHISVVLWRTSRGGGTTFGGGGSAGDHETSARKGKTNRNDAVSGRCKTNSKPSYSQMSESNVTVIVTANQDDVNEETASVIENTDAREKSSFSAAGPLPSRTAQGKLIAAAAEESDGQRAGSCDSETDDDCGGTPWPTPSRSAGAILKKSSIGVARHPAPSQADRSRPNAAKHDESGNKRGSAESGANQSSGLFKSLKVKKGASASNRTDNALAARRKVIRLLIAVVVCFACCVLPYHVRQLWLMYGGGPEVIGYWQHLVAPSAFILYYLNSSLNPLLYAFLSDKFRTSLRDVLSCRDYRQSRRMSVTMKTLNSVA